MSFRSNLISRIAVAIIAIPIIIYISLKGGIPILTFSVILSMLSAVEISNLLKTSNSLFFKITTPVFSSVLLILLIYELYIYAVMILILSVFSSALLTSFFNDVNKLKNVVIESSFAILYCGILFAFIPLLSNYPHDGGKWLVTLFIIIWCADTAAYFGGKATGKRKLASNISPGKTLEGLWWEFGGALVSAFIVGISFLSSANIFFLLIISVIITGMGVVGDLFESALKRNAEVKDSSGLIPGHGGVLDRFDSVLFAAPTLYILLILRDLCT